MYDITKLNTFLNIENRLSKLREHAEYNIDVLLVGNKSDLKKQRTVSYEKATHYASAHGRS